MKAADAGFPAVDGAPAPTTRASYVLVHGAWMGAWSWDAVAAGLRARGATVTVVELPAHGADESPRTSATLDAYVNKVDAAIDASAMPVILVGHSMGGVVITQAAETRPDKIAHLVYLTAFVPKDGESLLGLASTDAESKSGKHLKVDMTGGTADIPKDTLVADFCADCSPAAATKLLEHYKVEPLGPLAAPVHTTASGWGRVPKTYVYATLDQAISYGFQQKMTATVTFTWTSKLETSHAAMLAQPDKVVDALILR